MSSTSTPATEAHFAYLADHVAGADPLLGELERRCRAEDVPEIWISREQAAFMQVLLRAAGARRVVEVGTLAGFSAVAMARALGADGRVLTIEISPARAEAAERLAAGAGVGERVEVVVGDGREVLRSLPDASADALFVDADKEGYVSYVEEGLRIVRPGGLLLVDNAFAFGRLLEEGEVDGDVLAIRELNERMARREGLSGIIVPIGDGLWVCVVEQGS